MADQPTPSPELLSLTAQIVSAHVGKNAVPTEVLPRLIETVHKALRDASAPARPPKPTASVPVNRSVFPDHIVCLEDGKKVVMLKRHLKTAHGVTPQQYRERWDLPRDYPMVAPNYAERRSAMAAKSGLGRRPAAAEKGEQAAASAARSGRRRR
jgi:predicted transcriptional regulator